VLNVIKEPFLGPPHSHTLYQYTHQKVGCYIGSYTPQVCDVAGTQYWKSQSKGNNAGYICHGKQGEWVCWTYLGYWGSSAGGGVQNIAQEQLIRETAHQVSKVLSPRPVPVVTQSSGPLYNKIRDELGKRLDLPTKEKIFFVDLAERIAKELNVTNCWVCGCTLMSEEWHWKGTSLNAYQVLLWNQCITSQESN
jgi:hypothetical protein